jgi:hypothetical protein
MEEDDFDLFAWGEKFGTREEPASRMEAKFWIFHEEHPHIYALFDRFTRQVLARGYTHHSARDVIHRIRWETKIEATDPEFKINDHYSAYYGRLWMRDNPEHAGFFEIRATRDKTSERLDP